VWKGRPVGGQTAEKTRKDVFRREEQPRQGELQTDRSHFKSLDKYEPFFSLRVEGVPFLWARSGGRVSSPGRGSRRRGRGSICFRGENLPLRRERSCHRVFMASSVRPSSAKFRKEGKTVFLQRARWGRGKVKRVKRRTSWEKGGFTSAPGEGGST